MFIIIASYVSLTSKLSADFSQPYESIIVSNMPRQFNLKTN